MHRFFITIGAALLLLCMIWQPVCAQEVNNPGTAKNVNLVLIDHVNIINIRNGNIEKDKAILIHNNIIEAVGDPATFGSKASHAQKLNAGGRYAIPGLWDMHMHIEGTDLVEDNLALLPVYLAYGVTTVRDCASDLGMQVLAWRNEINNGRLLGPRIYTAGRKLEGLHTMWKGAMEIGNEQDLKEKLDSLVGFKVDFIK